MSTFSFALCILLNPVPVFSGGMSMGRLVGGGPVIAVATKPLTGPCVSKRSKPVSQRDLQAFCPRSGEARNAIDRCQRKPHDGFTCCPYNCFTDFHKVGGKRAVACSITPLWCVVDPHTWNQSSNEARPMPVTKPRNRLVYFRVSEDEFEQFCQMREQQGARCLSDLVRSAMIREVNGVNKDLNHPMATQIKQLADQVGQVNLSIQQLTELIHGQVGQTRPTGHKLKASVKGKSHAQSA